MSGNLINSRNIIQIIESLDINHTALHDFFVDIMNNCRFPSLLKYLLPSDATDTFSIYLDFKISDEESRTSDQFNFLLGDEVMTICDQVIRHNSSIWGGFKVKIKQIKGQRATVYKFEKFDSSLVKYKVNEKTFRFSFNFNNSLLDDFYRGELEELPSSLGWMFTEIGISFSKWRKKSSSPEDYNEKIQKIEDRLRLKSGLAIRTFEGAGSNVVFESLLKLSNDETDQEIINKFLLYVNDKISLPLRSLKKVGMYSVHSDLLKRSVDDIVSVVHEVKWKEVGLSLKLVVSKYSYDNNRLPGSVKVSISCYPESLVAFLSEDEAKTFVESVGDVFAGCAQLAIQFKSKQSETDEW